MTEAPLQDAELAAIRKLLEVAECETFDPEEMEAIRTFLDTWRGLRALGRIGRVVVVVLTAIGGAILAWDTISAKVTAWLGQ